MRYLDLEEAVKEAEPFFDSKWEVQKDQKDWTSNFIYFCRKIDHVLELALSNDVDAVYAIHRWYNFITSKMAEELFEQFGATLEINPRSHEIDFYVKDIPYDLKLTVMPLKTQNKGIVSRKEKDNLIKWLYEHQSQQGRKHNANRIFIVCAGKDKHQSMLLKSNVDKLSEAICKFMEYYKDKELNKVEIDGNQVYADLIYITE